MNLELSNCAQLSLGPSLPTEGASCKERMGATHGKKQRWGGREKEREKTLKTKSKLMKTCMCPYSILLCSQLLLWTPLLMCACYFSWLCVSFLSLAIGQVQAHIYTSRSAPITALLASVGAMKSQILERATTAEESRMTVAFSLPGENSRQLVKWTVRRRWQEAAFIPQPGYKSLVVSTDTPVFFCHPLSLLGPGFPFPSFLFISLSICSCQHLRL